MTALARGRVDTNTHSYFFRETPVLVAVREWMRSRVVGAGPTPAIWSAGCSGGQEPYSLAIPACELGVEVNIVGTDVNPEALERARTARYALANLRRMSAERQQRWFDRDQGQLEVRREVRRRVTFEYHELPDPAPQPRGRSTGQDAWDIILCRNVLIHFDHARVAKTIEAFIRALAPDGILFLGASEWLGKRLEAAVPNFDRLELCEYGGAIGYRKRRPEERATSASTRPAIAPNPARAHERLVPRRQPLSPSPPSPPSSSPSSSRPQLRAVPFATDLERLRQAGDKHLDSGDLGGALERYERALLAADLAADLHLRVGVCQMRLGDEEAAIKALRRSLFLEPKLWPAAWLLGDLVAVTNKTAAARYLRQALEVLEVDGNVLEQDGLFAPFFTGSQAASEAIKVRLAQLHTLSVGRAW